ncbi:helix-turn-helix domain-containing protein [Patescibacteria group bacterium]|nr:helix-turn-helix domain-containing protein [Patescibacteria group bacterium]
MSKKENNHKDLLTISEVAEKFGVHVETLRRWDNQGKLKAIRFGKRGHRRYRRSEIEKTLKDHGAKR